MFCSVVIPTIGRSTLARAVESVLDQTLAADEYEVIVVNDSAKPLPEADWQQSDRVKVIGTNRRERSIARNTGASIAAGEYLCFLDDDDWLLPDALATFRRLARVASDAVWLCGGLEVVDESGARRAAFRPDLDGNCLAQVMGGAWAPLQSSLIRADAFFRVGGFDAAIGVTQDLDLCRRVSMHGDYASTPTSVGCLLRGPGWATSTNYLRAPENTLRSRDSVLAEAGAFRRMLRSARTSYWRGRVLRVYASTAVHNLRHRRLFAAWSRGIHGVFWLALSGRDVLSRSFWLAARAHHVPNTLHFIVAEIEREEEGARAGRREPSTAG